MFDAILCMDGAAQACEGWKYHRGLLRERTITRAVHALYPADRATEVRSIRRAPGPSFVPLRDPDHESPVRSLNTLVSVDA